MNNLTFECFFAMVETRGYLLTHKIRINKNQLSDLLDLVSQSVLELSFALFLRNISSIALSNLPPILMPHFLCNLHVMFTS